MKRKGKLLILFMAIMLITGISSYPVEAASHMSLEAKAKSLTAIELSWKKKNVDKYRIYRAVEKSNGDIGKFKLIATVGKSKTKYKDSGLKTGKNYHYEVKGYKNGKQKYQGGSSAHAGVWCAWDEDQIPDAPRSADSITLRFSSYYGVKPDGYKIYRAADGSDEFSLITTIKTSAVSMEYVDENVETGKFYDYKVRAYVNTKKGKRYSKYTYVISMSATNQIGGYTAQVVQDKDCGKDEAVIMLTGKEGNGELKLSSQAYLEMVDASGKELTTFDSEINLIAYSTDQINWMTYDQNEDNLPAVSEDQSVWIKIKSKGGEILNQDGKLKEYKIEMWDVKYNRLNSILTIDLVSGTAEAKVNEEMYH